MRYPPKRGAPFQNPRGTRGASPGNARWFWGASDYMTKADTWPLNPQGELLAVLCGWPENIPGEIERA